MTPKQISQMLNNSIEAICRELYPDGKKQSGEWWVGSLDGEKGQSLKINLTGRAGVWSDFSTGESGGDLLDLYMAANRTSLVEALAWARDYLGIKDDKPQYKLKSYAKPPKPQCKKPEGEALDWLTKTRNLPESAITAYRIAVNGDNVVFPSLRDGELVRYKIRNIHDKHKCTTSSDSEPCLFGWQAIPERAREVVICEGEIDAVSWHAFGFPALSVPNGAQGHSWVEVEYDNLERFDVIYLSMDMDDAGQKAVSELVERLGRERTKVVELPNPWKDINDILVGAPMTNVGAYLDHAKTQDPYELKPSEHYRDKIIDIFTGKNKADAGYYMPWSKVKDRFRFRPGELTILAGENFHGKSEGAGHITLDVMHQDGRVCVASMEFKPERWIARLVQQAAGVAKTDAGIGYVGAIMDWLQEKLWAFDVSGTTKPEKIIEVFTYAKRRYNVNFFVIDNLAKCGFSEDDYNGQKSFIDKLTDFTRDYGTHVVLVHHLNKGEDDGQARGKSAVKGTGAITDMADNVLIWWRNRKK